MIIRLADGTAAIVCTGQRRHRCCLCDQPGGYQCDAPVIRRGKACTCDRWLCQAHRKPVGPNRDYCPAHWHYHEEIATMPMHPIGEAIAAVVDHVETIRSIRDMIADLDRHAVPRDVPLIRWRQMILDSREFIDQELAFMALEYGWTVHQLWGADRRKPFARIDHAGLLWLVNGAAIEDLGERYCVLFRPATGSRLTYRPRWIVAPPPLDEICLPWEFT